jgi:hypothetical protein
MHLHAGPTGRPVNSQGREPLDSAAIVNISPNGAAVRLPHRTVAPLGLKLRYVARTRGSRPWLLTAAALRLRTSQPLLDLNQLLALR